MRLLLKARQHVIENNEGKNHPYHNNQHIFGMAEIAGLIYMQVVDGVSRRDYLNLMLGCLFHDFNHSGGTVKDFFNIRASVISFYEFYDRCVDANESGITLVSPVVVENIIRCTEYPFPRTPDTLLEKCARDADILYASMSMDPKVIMEGLRHEIIISSKKHISYADMMVAQRKFAEDAVMFTGPGDDLMNIYGPKYLKAMEKYVADKGNDSGEEA